MRPSIAAFGVSVPTAAWCTMNSSATFANGADEAFAASPKRGTAADAEAAREEVADAADESAWGAAAAAVDENKGATVGKIPGTLN
jgi:hypothetical protein